MSFDRFKKSTEQRPKDLLKNEILKFVDTFDRRRRPNYGIEYGEYTFPLNPARNLHVPFPVVAYPFPRRTVVIRLFRAFP